jgi:acyl-CoA dehydrogenase
MVRNGFRTVLLSLSRGSLAFSTVSGATAKYYRQLAWASATFAFLTDIVLISFGGTLKRREKLTGRFADILSWMYLGTATLRRYEAEGRQPEDLPLVDWAMQYAFAQIQQGFEGIFNNLPILRGLGVWWRLNPIGINPRDRLGSQIARILQTPGQQRDKLTEHIYIPSDPEEALGRLERAFSLLSQVEPVLKKIKVAIASGKLPQQKPERSIAEALEAKIINEQEAKLVRESQNARNDAIVVDSFTLEEYQQIGLSSVTTIKHQIEQEAFISA